MDEGEFKLTAYHAKLDGDDRIPYGEKMRSLSLLEILITNLLQLLSSPPFKTRMA